LNKKNNDLPKILIVEDSTSAQRRLISTLQAYAKCYVSGNGQEAIDFVQSICDEQEQFDCIFMDIIMPIKDGLSAVKEIRKLERDKNIFSKQKIKIVIVSTLKDPKEILLAQYECQADGYITKPYARSSVLETLKDLGLDICV